MMTPGIHAETLSSILSCCSGMIVARKYTPLPKYHSLCVIPVRPSELCITYRNGFFPSFTAVVVIKNGAIPQRNLLLKALITHHHVKELCLDGS
uniref:Uncharacterized protein n=1 Tax=Lepeophtheirus salmonis TaxID=72036 RepID=A0A0K2URL4_LEPSM